MRTWALLGLLCWTITATPGRVVDGDTFDVTGRIWLDQTNTGRVRVVGIDTPERAAGPTAQAATAYTAAWLAASGGTVTLRVCARDPFGRWLADVTRADGRNLGADLLDAGHATRWAK